MLGQDDDRKADHATARPPLAEGTPLEPDLVVPELADPARAVWLLPTTEFERARMEESGAAAAVSDPERARENRIQLALLEGAAIERQARERGATVLTVDGSRAVDEMVTAVEIAFAEALAGGPRAESPAQRQALLRYANATIASQVLAYFARVPAAADTWRAVYPFA